MRSFYGSQIRRIDENRNLLNVKGIIYYDSLLVAILHYR